MKLSSKDMQIIELLCEGKAFKEIGALLRLSANCSRMRMARAMIRNKIATKAQLCYLVGLEKGKRLCNIT